MRIRFQADNDLRKAIVRGVVRRSAVIDFRSAQNARLHGVDDPLVLAIAAEEGRILVSHDFQTMPGHLRDFIKTRHSPGVFLVSQELPVGQAVDALALIWEASDAEEWKDRLCLLPSFVTILMR